METEKLETITGVKYSTIILFARETNDIAATATVFAMCKWALSWEMLYLQWRAMLHQEDSMTSFRRRVSAALDTMASVPLRPAESRMNLAANLLPNATVLIDTFPVNVRGPTSLFNGKYKGKVLKFQAVTTLTGEPLVIMRSHRDTSFDSTVLKMIGLGLVLEPWELVVGDKGYQGCTTVVTPVKLQRSRRLTTNEALANKYIQLIRSPIERFFSRLHQFRFMKWSAYSKNTVTSLVRVAAATVAMDAPQEASRYLSQRNNEQRPAPCAAKAALVALGQRLAVTTLDLRGKNSTKRGRDEPEFKNISLDFEKDCPKCKQPRTMCTCKATLKARGRPKKQQQQQPPVADNVEVDSDGSSSSTTLTTSSSSDTDQSSSSDSAEGR
jgi:hypothetical protein